MIIGAHLDISDFEEAVLESTPERENKVFLCTLHLDTYVEDCIKSPREARAARRSDQSKYKG